MEDFALVKNLKKKGNIMIVNIPIITSGNILFFTISLFFIVKEEDGKNMVL